MSKTHILETDNNLEYNVVVHIAVPAGSNSAGKSWKDVVLGAGLNVSRLTEGVAPGNITTAELASITAGDIIEFSTSVKAESGGRTVIEMKSAVNKMVDQFITDKLDELKNKYKYYGHTQDAI